MKDHEIDTISAFVLKLTGERYEWGQTGTLIRALEAGAKAKVALEAESRLEKEMIEKHAEEDAMLEEPVIMSAPVSPKGFFKR